MPSRYEISDKLGAGGMGEVFLARDTSLDRLVALKQLPEKLQEDETARKRFVREAKSGAALDHPYICKIFEIGVDEDGAPFIAMEYVRGETLQERLSKGDVPSDEVRRIASEIAEALEIAHQEGIVHRDLKPSNIMLTETGHVKVMDFGLAKRTTSFERDDEHDTSSRLTGEGMTLGTVAYMSPEQLRGEPATPSSDIFSFGIVLYELATGNHPFRQKTPMETAAAILNQAPAPIKDELGVVVQNMLVKDPGKRCPSTTELRTELARAKPPRSTRRLVLGVLGGLGLVALGIALGSSLLPREPPSVAVLPMRNISEDPLESDYLAEGISQAVIARLVQAGLRVTPWDTARRYGHSGEPPEEVARALNADTVLMGTFHLAGDRLLTSLSLVEADSGVLAWAQQFEAEYEDIFHMQQQIAVRAATSLKQSLTGKEEEVLALPESRSVDAYDFYMQGAYLMDEGTREATEVAFDYFERASELDPTLAEAHVGLGVVEHERYLWGWGGGPESLERARRSFERVLALKPDSMKARRGLMHLNFQRGRAEENLILGREAERFGRGQDVETLLARATGFQFGGLHERATPLLREVVRIDPENLEAHWRLVTNNFGTEDEIAVEAAETFFRRFGEDPEVHLYAGISHQLLGDTGRAIEHYERAIGPDASAAERVPEAILFGGLLHERLGNSTRANELWQLGVDVFAPKVEESPNNSRLILILGSFHGLLRDDNSLRAMEARADVGENWWATSLLAAVHLTRGEASRTAELLRESAQHGFVEESWSVFLRLTGVPFPETTAFRSFVRAQTSERSRMRSTY